MNMAERLRRDDHKIVAFDFDNTKLNHTTKQLGPQKTLEFRRASIGRFAERIRRPYGR